MGRRFQVQKIWVPCVLAGMVIQACSVGNRDGDTLQNCFKIDLVALSGFHSRLFFFHMVAITKKISGEWKHTETWAVNLEQF